MLLWQVCVQKLILGPTINSTKINIINKNESPSAKKMFCFINTSAWLKNTSITIALINATNVEYENQPTEAPIKAFFLLTTDVALLNLLNSFWLLFWFSINLFSMICIIHKIRIYKKYKSIKKKKIINSKNLKKKQKKKTKKKKKKKTKKKIKKKKKKKKKKQIIKKN
nr:hypothetical protein [Mycoplasmopsis bovis]